MFFCSALIAGGCASNEPTYPGKPVAVDTYVSGYEAMKAGDTATAQKQLEAAVAKNPNLIMARIALGDLYRKQNDFTDAAAQYEVLVQKDYYTLNNHYYLGTSYQLLTRYKDAARAYLVGLKLQPSDFKSNMNLGTVYLALGDDDQAVNYLDKATQIDPNSAAAWSNLGVALDAKDSFVLAETAYRKAIELDSNSQVVLQNLANNLLLQKKTGEAIYLWEQIVAKNKTPLTQTKLAAAYVAGSDFSRADEQVDSVLKTDPRYVPAINVKARCRIKQYELSGFADDHFRAEAVALLKQSLAMNSSQPSVAKDLKKYEKALPLGQ